ncbi:MAG: hypothetical protein WAW80_03950 [Candidatus Saccharimonadales bacterium]
MPEQDSYIIPSREVLIDANERLLLAQQSKDLIEETFVFNDYSERITTTDAVELYNDGNKAPNTTFWLLMPRIYDRAYVEMNLDHFESRAISREIKILLTKNGQWPNFHTELIISGDESEYVSHVDVDSPQYYLRTPGVKSGEAERISPLDYESATELLQGLVKQAYSGQKVDKSLTHMQLASKLIDASTEVTHERRTKYRLSHPRNLGKIVIGVADTYKNAPGSEPRHRSHTVIVDSTRPLYNDDSTTTHLELSVKPESINTTFGISVSHSDNGSNKFDQYENLANAEVHQFNDTEIAFPSRFGKKIIDALYILAQQPNDMISEYIIDDIS